MNTILGEVIAELDINKSTFITYLKNVTTVEDAKDYITYVKLLHPVATHHVTAYTVGKTGEYGHSSDDGEPSGTAGLPVLDVFRKNDITNFVCIVVRYFGGIKLGAGGLVRAYSSSASETIKKAPRVELVTMNSYSLTFPYDYIRQLDYLLESKNAIITNKDYDISVTYTFFSNYDNLSKDIQELSSGTLELVDLGPSILEKEL